jgi:hypothetical protein
VKRDAWLQSAAQPSWIMGLWQVHDYTVRVEDLVYQQAASRSVAATLLRTPAMRLVDDVISPAQLKVWLILFFCQVARSTQVG